MASANASATATVAKLEDAVSAFCLGLSSKPYRVERYAAFPCRCDTPSGFAAEAAG
jgi:hypothetical protein